MTMHIPSLLVTMQCILWVERCLTYWVADTSHVCWCLQGFSHYCKIGSGAFCEGAFRDA
jgi:hypothetical protein